MQSPRFALLAAAIAIGAAGSGRAAENTKIPRPDDDHPSKPIERLADIVSPSMEIQMSSVADSYFRLTVQGPRYAVDAKGRCILPAPRARATLNGIAMTRIRGVYRGGDLSYNRDCLIEFGFGPPLDVRLGTGRERIQMGRPLPRSATTSARATIRIEDDSARWTWEIPEAFADRRLSFKSPSDGTLFRGRETLLRWSPAGDHVGPQLSVEIERSATVRQALPATIRGNQVSFTLPSNLPDAFDGRVTIRINAAVAPATAPCPVSNCQVSLDVPATSITGQINAIARAREEEH